MIRSRCRKTPPLLLPQVSSRPTYAKAPFSATLRLYWPLGIIFKALTTVSYTQTVAAATTVASTNVEPDFISLPEMSSFEQPQNTAV